MNDDGDWWVPIGALPFDEARASVVACLSYLIPEDGTLVYKGKTVTWLDSEHEAGCEEDCPTLRHLPAYHWIENAR